jgi:hypothetical protein
MTWHQEKEKTKEKLKNVSSEADVRQTTHNTTTGCCHVRHSICTTPGTELEI